MKKGLNYVLTGLLAVAFLGSCKKDDDNNNNPNPNPNPQGTTFGFLKAGNEWKYNGTAYDTVTGTDSTITNAFTMKITKDMGNNTFEMISYFDSSVGSFTDTAYIYRDNNEIAVKDTTGAKYTYLKANPVVNDSYYGPDSTLITVMSVSETVVVPAGTFNCVKIKEFEPMDPNEFQYTYIDKVQGIIKYVFYENNKLVTEMELKSKNF